jgi:hypothetical protein
MAHQTVLFFVPGYLTGTATQSYNDVVRAAKSRNWAFEYITLPNNNSGDLGNTTMEHCLEYIVRQYNMLESNLYTGAEIILAGHDLGGLLVLRLMSEAVGHLLIRKPSYVRVINPTITPIIPKYIKVLGTVLSFFPSIVRLLCLPVPVASYGVFYHTSPDFSPAVKQVLSLSLLCHTGSLYMHNTTWDLMPFINARKLIKVYQSKNNRMVDIYGVREYCQDNRVPLIEIDSIYHQHTEDDVIDRIYSIP